MATDAAAEKEKLWTETLPPPDVTDAKAKQWVLEVLNKNVMSKVVFQVPGLKYGFNPELFKQVRLRVQFSDIRVYERDGGNARLMDLFGYIDLPDDAAYFRDLDIMVVKAASRDIYYEAIVVHECVHAALDMFGANGSPLKVSTAMSESVAYIAQAVYARASYEALGFKNKDNPFEDSSDGQMQAIFDKAWEISAKILGGATRVTDADIAVLVGLVPNTMTYKNKPKFVNYNGVAERPWWCE